jgi:hypothetical protein
MIAGMETLSPALADEADERVARLGRVKFVGLPPEAAGATLGPALRDDLPVAGPQAAARPFRLLQLLRRIASRVDGRPSAARP